MARFRRSRYGWARRRGAERRSLRYRLPPSTTTPSTRHPASAAPPPVVHAVTHRRPHRYHASSSGSARDPRPETTRRRRPYPRRVSQQLAGKSPAGQHKHSVSVRCAERRPAQARRRSSARARLLPRTGARAQQGQVRCHVPLLIRRAGDRRESALLRLARLGFAQAAPRATQRGATPWAAVL